MGIFFTFGPIKYEYTQNNAAKWACVVGNIEKYFENKCVMPHNKKTR